MARTPLPVTDLLDIVTEEQAAADVASYFRPATKAGEAPPYTGGRFESFAGGGDRPGVANGVTAEDLVAVTLLSVRVPGRAALHLLEGRLGDQIAALLVQVPTDVALHDPAAAALLMPGSPVRQVWDLLTTLDGVGWVVAGKVLARKRPHLVPVYDNVVRCALGAPAGMWTWLHEALTADENAITTALQELKRTAGVPEGVSLLRILDVILWMRHLGEHRPSGCAELVG